MTPTETCREPPSLDRLLAWRQGELAPDEAERVEAHFFGCDACTRRLETLEGLRSASAALMARGGFPVAVTSGVLAQAIRDGMHVRTYRLSAGEEVACTAAPDDDLVSVRLTIGVPGAERVDVELEALDLETGARQAFRVEDVPVDRASGELVYAYPAAAIRAHPRSRWRYELVLGADGRRIGPFELDHTPWEALAEKP